MRSTWNALIAEEFQHLNLGDQRLNARCQTIAQALAKHPDHSLPKACADWKHTKAAYRFFANAKAEHAAVLASPITATVARCRREAGEVVVIHDTTFLNFTSHAATDGLGPIGATAQSLWGMLVHTALAVTAAQGEVVGLVHQEFWARASEAADPREDSKRRRQRPRESACWLRGMQAVQAHRLSAVIHVADRAADIYEALVSLQGQRFIIRACQNRRLLPQTALFEAVRHRPTLGTVVVPVSARPRHPARQAHVTVRAATVTVQPPAAVNRRGPALPLQVVELWEAHPPRHVEALHWILLTSEPVQTLADCTRVARLYTYRWKIEEFHMALKTGCRIEARQLATRQRLAAFLALASVISVLLLRLRETARGHGQAAACLTATQLVLLHERFPDVGPAPTAQDALRAVARLGGFLARKRDGQPGWRTLWRGLYDLLLMEHGYDLALSARTSRSSERCG